MSVQASSEFIALAQNKELKLRAALRTKNFISVAYSGGVDSTYLVTITAQELGTRAEAILAVSPSLARREKDSAVSYLRDLGIKFKIVKTDEMDHSEYTRNDPSRCFQCKKALFEECYRVLQYRDSSLAYGFNQDDLGDFRPGHKAALRYQVWSPLLDVGLTKDEIRYLSMCNGIRGSDRPSNPCLASRLTYYTPVTQRNLMVVEEMENFFHDQGFLKCRARFDGQSLRIEVPESEIPLFMAEGLRKRIVTKARELKVPFIGLDLEGLISGKNNRVVPQCTE